MHYFLQSIYEYDFLRCVIIHFILFNTAYCFNISDFAFLLELFGDFLCYFITLSLYRYFFVKTSKQKKNSTKEVTNVITLLKMASARSNGGKRSLPMVSLSTLSENTSKKPRVEYAKLPQVFQKWKLPGNIDIRAGIVRNEAILRISSLPDLEDMRPTSPTPYGTLSRVYAESNESKPDEIAKTVFLKKDEIMCMHKVLKRLQNNWEAVDEGESLSEKLSNLTDDERESMYQFQYMLDSSSKITIFPSAGRCEITMYSLVLGNNQADQSLEERGKVALSEEAFVILCQLSSEITAHMRDLTYALNETADEILKIAGGILSKMLFSKYGRFTDKEVNEARGSIVHAFMIVYSEFKTFNYTLNLTHQIGVLLRENPHILRPRLNLISLVAAVVDQIDILFDGKYIIMPK